jgi:hypothetical protein
MFGLFKKMVFKSELKTIFGFHNAILLDGYLDPVPLKACLLSKDRQVALLEEFHLVIHIVNSEGDCSVRFYIFNREVKPCFVR